MKYSDYFKDLSAGSKKQTEIVINGYTDTLPATLIRGRENGKSILITTGMHSGEYPGIPATLTAAERIDPEKVSGRIMMIHCLNPSGFRERTDNYVPEDGKNMNRIFPSDNTGTPADRIVSFVSKELLPETDFVLDLHSGGQSERLTDHLYFPAEGQAAEESLKTASFLNFPYLTASYSRGGEVGYAGNILGIPGLLLERGHSGYCLPEWTENMTEDILTVLTALGVLPGTLRQNQSQTVFRKAVYTESDTEGLWYPYIQENEKVRRGQILGEVRNFRNEILQTVSAEGDGIVLYFTPGLSARPGWPLVAYGLSEKLTE